ncbi:MAG: hypothetical protein Q8P18_11930 [Pseudomonadota bacterium]|nr:hypothetical protein [Pseudomonadota bacterium]
MADADATNPGAAVRLWIRRTSEPHGAYTIRFEVADGKGILRVGRPGVLVDPPARPSGSEERLTAAQVSTTRFLHVWDGGRYRQAHALTRLTEAQLEGLPAERWVGLAFVTEGSALVLMLPSIPDVEEADGREPARVDDEPTWPRREMLAVLQRELREMEAKEGEHDRTDIRSKPPDQPAAPRASRAEIVEIAPRAAARPPPPSEAPRAASVGPADPYASLDAWLNSPIPSDPNDRGDEEQTILMGGSALAIDRMDGLRDPPRTALPSLPPLPLPMDPYDDLAIEAGEAPDDDESDQFDLVAMDDGASGLLEALEAPPDDDEMSEEDGEPLDEITDLGRPHKPENRHLQRSQITEPVTEIPIFRRSRDLPFADDEPPDEPSIGAGEAEEDEEDHPGDQGEQGDPLLAPKAEFHERNTTLVRFLRRRITSDRTRILALEQRVAELEALLARRAAR